MFSPNMFRYILDPDNITDECAENRKVFIEKHMFKCNVLDYEKILSDYSFFNRVLGKFVKAFEFFASHSKQFILLSKSNR